jgi:hypothetical protein
VHPREVDEHFSHGTVKNYWGGSSNATTHLLDEMHYRGLLRVARREKGIRIYTAHQHELSPEAARAGRVLSAAPPDAAQHHEWVSARIDALVDVVVRIYAPLPAASLSFLVSRLLCGAAVAGQLKSALERADSAHRMRALMGRLVLACEESGARGGG